MSFTIWDEFVLALSIVALHGCIGRNPRAKREAVVTAHIAAEAEQHDVAVALATFHRPRYEVPAMGAIIDGADAVQGLLGHLLGAFSDFWLRRMATHHADDAVIVECKFGGTHRGPRAASRGRENQWKCKAR